MHQGTASIIHLIVHLIILSPNLLPISTSIVHIILGLDHISCHFTTISHPANNPSVETKNTSLDPTLSGCYTIVPIS